MKVCRSCRIGKSPSEFSARTASPDGLSYKCKACDKEYRGHRKDHYRKLRRERYLRCHDGEKAVALEYYRSNRERCIEAHAEYMIRTSEQQKEYWRKNKAAFRLRTAKYRAALRQRTPSWLTEEDFKLMDAFYRLAVALEEDTGVPHHVDHVYPLNGTTVSGLHCPTNLCVIPAKANLSKGNRRVL